MESRCCPDLPNLTFGFYYNENMEKMALPANLRNFMSDANRDRSIENVAVPSQQNFTTGAEKIPLRAGLQKPYPWLQLQPERLRSFMIGGVINQGMEKASLPTSGENVALPISLQIFANGVRCRQDFNSYQCTSRTRRSPTTSQRN